MEKLTVKQALERGIKYAASAYVFETLDNGHIFNIEEDIEEMKECTDLVFCEKLSGGYDVDFIYDLIHRTIEEDDELYIEDASVITDGTDEIVKALAAKMTDNFNKRRYFRTLGIKVIL